MSILSITETESGKEITVSAVNTKNGSTILLGGYKDGKMTFFDYKAYTGEDLTFTVLSTAEYDFIKVFMAESTESLKPLALPRIFK